MDWDKVKTFYHVARLGNMTRAADYLRRVQSAISKQISLLEDDLGTRLFFRSSRGLTLTRQGEILFNSSEDVFRLMQKTENLMKDELQEPQGKIKVGVTSGFASTYVLRHMAEFLAKYPKIELTILTSDKEAVLENPDTDIFIVSEVPQLPQRQHDQLMNWNQRLFASKDYVEKHGMPKNAEDLDNHQVLVLGDAVSVPAEIRQWILWLGREKLHKKDGKRAGGTRRPYLTFTSSRGMMDAVQYGLGIAALPSEPVYTEETTDLVEVLPDLKGPVTHIEYIYDRSLKDVKRITVLRDFLKEKIKEDKKLIAEAK